METSSVASFPEPIAVFRKLLFREFFGGAPPTFSEVVVHRSAFESYLDSRYKSLFSGKDPSHENVLELLFLEAVPQGIYERYLQVCFFAIRKCVVESFDFLLEEKEPKSSDTSKIEYVRRLVSAILMFLSVFERHLDPSFPGYPVGLSNVVPSRQIFHSTYSHVFNNFDSGFSSSFVTQPIAVFLIRQAIEVRIKNCLGIHLVRTRRDYKSVKKTSDYLIEFVYSREQYISLPVGRTEIEKVHNWTNLFVHTGIFPEMYKIWYAMKTVEPLFSHGTHDGTWHSAGAVRIDRKYYETLLDQEVKEFISRKLKGQNLTAEDLEIEKTELEAMLV